MSFKLINDIFLGNIQFSDFESNLMRHSLLNRLHQILQNGTVYFVYPCNRTTRFNHSIGTMHYASEIFRNGLMNTTEKCADDYFKMLDDMMRINDDKQKIIVDFFSSTDTSGEGRIKLKNSLKKIGVNIDNLSSLLQTTYFQKALSQFVGEEFLKRHSMKSWDGNKNVSYILTLQSVRFYGLFHDIGHLPFSHLFEFAIENIFMSDDSSQVSGGDKDIVRKVEEITKKSSLKKIHEVIGTKLFLYILKEHRCNILSEYSEPERSNEEKCIAVCKIIILFIIEWLLVEINNSKYGRLNSIYKIVSGDIDADRLDYVQRDLLMSGLLKGTGNIDRIIKMFCLCKYDKEFLFLPAIQALNDVEEIIKDRYSLYKYVINHHAVRRTDYILQSAIEKSIVNEVTGSNTESETHNRQDNFILNRITDIINYIYEFITVDNLHNYKEVVYKYSQVTDSWLLTYLNERFVRIHLEDMGKKRDDKLHSLLEELFHISRSYKSLWKWPNEYRRFRSILEEEYKECNIGQINATDVKDSNSPGYKHLVKYTNDWVEKSWTKDLENRLSEDKESGYLVTMVNLNSGLNPIIDERLRLVNLKNIDETLLFEEVSPVGESLESDRKEAIRFYVYKYRHTSKNSDTILEEYRYIAKKMIQMMLDNNKKEMEE